MACKIKTLLQCKHCGHELEVASYYMTVRDDRRPLLWCPDCDILYQYFGPEEVVVDRSASVEYDSTVILLPVAEYERLLASVKNKNYIRGLVR